LSNPYKWSRGRLLLKAVQGRRDHVMIAAARSSGRRDRADPSRRWP